MDKRRTNCARPAWQKFQFPTCNILHEINLPHLEERSVEGPLGFLANGYWRDVWAVDSSYNNETAVLKIMRLKHDIDAHNFDRHRRDGLVMERLTGSPHVIDPYGFCGNSVLTEFLPKTLDKVAKGLDPSLVKYTLTRLDRLQLALGAARGLAALHEIPGGPIIHVDLGARQFLVGEDGNVKINDFNRCRFMGYYKSTKQPCDFRIQIAPGTDRAPEEYRELPSQNEKLDLFSFGNVLYIILTGREPWPYYYWGYAEPIIQRLIVWGIKPSLPQRVRRSDPELSELMYLLYALNPEDRPTAADVVRSIEQILAKENVTYAINS
jgi:serine/threonine protein kinase